MSSKVRNIVIVVLVLIVGLPLLLCGLGVFGTAELVDEATEPAIEIED